MIAMFSNTSSESYPTPDYLEVLQEGGVLVVGGGAFCKTVLEFLYSEFQADRRPRLLGVFDIKPDAVGRHYAARLGIPTGTDYRDLLDDADLKTIIELTDDLTLADRIRRTMPAGVRLIDHCESRAMWDMLQVGVVKQRCRRGLMERRGDAAGLARLLEEMVDRFDAIIRTRNKRSLQIESELVEHERTQSQIIQGSTIPTFVLDHDHVVTHWNRAMEVLTGVPADEMVGTSRQGMPFWGRQRPTMADVILDQFDEARIEKLYGRKWRKSQLIEGAYEAEVFFPSLGTEGGKWCWFTAAPIKAPDGSLIGAIETLWDTTEDKRAEEQRERYTRELGALLSIYTALSAPLSLESRIEAVFLEIRQFLGAERIDLFLAEDTSAGEGGDFRLDHRTGPAVLAATSLTDLEDETLITQVADSGELKIIERTVQSGADDDAIGGETRFDVRLYVPISAKAKKGFGVVRIDARRRKPFLAEEHHVLDLIGNRIGVAIENAMLQEQSIKSEEKYRSLFNNDPNPIFIIERRSLAIMDTNQRALACYGYASGELTGFPFLKLGDPQDEEMNAGMQSLPDHGALLFSKKKHYKKNGQPFYVNISVSQARYGDHDVVIATTTDITESVEKETQLVQASKMTTLGVMAAGMAHEINQPLNVIQICADFFLKMLGRGQAIPDGELKSMAEDIVDNVERATGIIKHVRDFARQSDIVRTMVDINAPIQDVFNVLGHQIKVHQIELDLDLSDDLPPIMAEHNRLEQVFINLVTNAIDTMDEKAENASPAKVEKKLRIASFLEAGQVTVSVADTGMGMSQEVKSKIFEPFYTTKKTGKGTGLGVSISYGIVKDYDGHILIESTVGEGTTFILKFQPVQADS
jgi:PAS domain S-box-containing protein